MPQLDATIDIGPFHFTHCSYDAESDVAYLSIGAPTEAIVWESPEGHLLRLDPDTDVLVGVTFLHLRERIESGALTITFPEYVFPRSGNPPVQSRKPVRVPRKQFALLCA
jgi:hypothetical protein